MTIGFLDWTIVAVVFAAITIIAFGTKKYTRSVADFLAANRCAGRYLLAVAGGVAGNGAISIIMYFQIYYQAGFTSIWWGSIGLPLGLIIALTGWVIYRYRETRALTLAQFFEMRYGRSFRLFCGMLAFFGGIINFGIFPSVGARFFIYFCGLPEYFPLAGLHISTYAVVMAILLSVALMFTYLGGQIAVIVTDFVQGVFSNVVFAVVTIILMCMFDWSDIIAGLMNAPENASMIHPFHTSKVKDFNIWYFAIGAFASFYNTIGWQGSQGYNCSAINAHEAKMARVLGTWRALVMTLFLVYLPICAYAILHNPTFSAIADNVNQMIGGIENEEVRNQMIVPAVMRQLLPVGVTGMFCAMMLAAFISTNDTYLHSWGSIFLQDVVMPFRKKPFTAKQHMFFLRLSIFGVAVFVFFFSLFFRQTSHIALFFQITGAIFLGGSGSVIIGGLYWKKGTNAAAWSAMIVGSSLAVSGIVIHQLIDDFPVNEMVMNFIAMASSAITYIVISVLTSKEDCNIEKMLHRGKYGVHEKKEAPKPARGIKALITGDFSLEDKVIYYSFLIWVLGLWLIFIAGTIYNLIYDVPVESWVTYWKIYLYVILVVGLISTVWLTVGGILDMKKLFYLLATVKRDDSDDGTVVEKADEECETLAENK